MTEVILRHGFVPHEDTRDERLSGNTQRKFQFFVRQLQQFIFVPRNVLPGSPNEDANEGITFGCTMRELGGRPRAGKSFVSFAARDDVAITVERLGQISLSVGEGDGGG